MDDLFSAFDSSASTTNVAASLTKVGGKAAAAISQLSLPSTTTNANTSTSSSTQPGKKRARAPEVGNDSMHLDASASLTSSSSSSLLAAGGHDVGRGSVDGTTTTTSSSSSTSSSSLLLGLHHGQHGIDAIDAAAKMDLNPRRNEVVEEYVVRPPSDNEDDDDGNDSNKARTRVNNKSGGSSSSSSSSSSGSGSGRGGIGANVGIRADESDSDDSSDENAAADNDDGTKKSSQTTAKTSSALGASSISASTIEMTSRALSGNTKATLSSTTSISSSLVASSLSGNTEIGEALRPRLTRGDIDESKSTAPTIEDNGSTTSSSSSSSSSSDKPPAKSYPFTLDPFQRRSIECLERNESVLVSAHTSAGKTVVAEYAIAMSLRDKQRVIYTSPIKALSNQKYRDLFEEFADVGLMTGDVTINPNASCLVMTTEILRSMLYRGSEVMREVKWVIFDEIHYMRDRERGVVWEESIIMLPHKVRFVFLSATIPNAREFAEWVAKIHHQTCHVVYTDYRPTPLQHFIFPAGGDGVYLVVDEKGRFREDTFNKAMSALGASSLEDAVDDVVTKGGGKKSRMKGSKGKGGPTDLFKIVRMIMERRYDPVIVFSFSKRECEQYALAVAKLDFTSEDEKKLIEQVFLNAIDSLGEDDKALPQIDAILPLLKRGIGIHHGGLLPILKEVIEILFQESLLKILFATETFSMGINMPARTVVFTASRKWDGTDFRWISPGEYIQMSGRAGRRGLDDRGIVIQMIDEKMEPAAAKEILKGTADALNSAFHLGYNMLLNLQRMEGGDPERMMALSFHQFQSERAAPAMEEEVLRLTDQASALVKQGGIATHEEEALIGEYFQLCAGMNGVRDAMQSIITTPAYALPFMQPGRLLRIQENVVRGGGGSGESGGGNAEVVDWGWGILIDFQKQSVLPSSTGVIGAPSPSEGGDDKRLLKDASNNNKNQSFIILRVLLHTAPNPSHLLPPNPSHLLPTTSSSSSSSVAGAGGGGGGGGGATTKSVAPPPRPASASDVALGLSEFEVLPVLLPAVSAISSVRMNTPRDIRPRDARQAMADRLREVIKRLSSSSSSTTTTTTTSSFSLSSSSSSTPLLAQSSTIPLLDPVEDMQIETPEMAALVHKSLALQERIATHPLHTAADRNAKVEIYRSKVEIEARCRFLRERIKKCRALAMRETLRSMKRVLRRLGHIDASSHVVTVKGRVACEVNTSDELLATELIFTGLFNDLDAAQSAALLSCLVYTERSAANDDDKGEPLREELARPLKSLQDAARRIAQVSTDCRIELDPEEYVERFNSGMMELVYAWTNGSKFVDICGMTKEFEGTIVRVIRRLEELTRQLADAARAVGDEVLEAKFREASTKMRRDIIFAASLYL